MKILNELPSAIRKEVVKRFLYGLGAVLFFIVILLTSKDFLLCIPCCLISLFSFFLSGIMIYNYKKGKVISIIGICTVIERKKIRKTIASILLDVDGKAVKIQIKGRKTRINEGDTVQVYLLESSKVYNYENKFVISDYYALEVQDVVI